jgi:hypothetical protein
MNKNTSMSSIYNFFQDLLANKIPVEKGPLEEIVESNREMDPNKKKINEDFFITTEEEKSVKGKFLKKKLCFIFYKTY